MSSLTINQEKQIRALKRGAPLKYEVKDGAIAHARLEDYQQLARDVREFLSLEKKWGEKAEARRKAVLKEICLDMAALDEK